MRTCALIALTCLTLMTTACQHTNLIRQTETADYVGVGLARVGRLDKTFTDDAYEAICQLTRGVPRAINQLAEICLVGGAAEGLKVIDGSFVEAVREAFYSEGIGAVA